jgi:hypothetical protein
MCDEDRAKGNEVVIGPHRCRSHGQQGPATEEKDARSPKSDKEHGAPNSPGDRHAKLVALVDHQTLIGTKVSILTDKSRKCLMVLPDPAISYDDDGENWEGHEADEHQQ